MATEEPQKPFEALKLRKMRKMLDLTQQEMAEKLGIHRTYLVLIERGQKQPSLHLRKFIEDYMATAEAEGAKPADGNAAAPAPVAPAERKSPVVSWATAGAAKAYEELKSFIDETVETDCKDPDAFAIIIEGDSMEDKFFAGDRVIFAPHLEPRNGDAVVAKLNDGRVYFKWFHRTGPEGARVRLTSENENYQPLEFARADFQFIYPAWEVKRRLRK